MPRPVKKKKAQSQIEEQVEFFKRATQTRYDLARQTYDAQDDDTQQVIERIQMILCQNASGVIRVFPNGSKREQPVMVQVEMDYIEMNAFYVAIEILKDLAFMDVRVAGFQFAEAFCAECGVKLNDRGKGKKVRR